MMKITRELLNINYEDHMKMLNAIFHFSFCIAIDAGGGGGATKPASATGNNDAQMFLPNVTEN